MLNYEGNEYVKKRNKRMSVLMYMYSMNNYGKKGKKKEIGTFCQRCGRGVGKGFVYKETFEYEGFKICPNCLEDKKNGARSTPDIEDFFILKGKKVRKKRF